MPPARRSPPPVDPTPLLLDVWAATVEALTAEPEGDQRAELASALAGQLTEARERLGPPHPGSPGLPELPELPELPLGAYLRCAHPASVVSEQELDSALQAAETAVKDGGAAVVATPAGPVQRRVFLEERLLRAVSLGRRLSDPLVPDRPVLRHCVRLLARVLGERAPGRSVELRVPPHVAVQCVEGPRHTRGTPPNVVEAEPVAFLDVAFGLQDWTEAVISGRIRASGERADLRPWLPLLDGSGSVRATAAER